ncbi:MAG: YaaR family protein [Candidatus Pristimantibacillus lignocellulolyticus]|uniref:YaaR family protein n=1 Tax=Candidatus Pristimantibacillus lignocellulolyticus TaxID=2994561 RepID=A0A9J6ZJT6_9BACL|nr:MAG: YaaR family protein [Candidatus Pristimantibacillus lignocellulolyticus]
MRVDPSFRPLGQSRTANEGVNKQVQSNQFSEMLMQKNRQHTVSEMQQMIKGIQEQGDRLARHMTVRELKIYRQMVKQFLEDTLRKGIGLKEVRGFDRRGRVKRYKLLEEVDEKLVLLAEEMLATEEGRIQLLHTLGEIRGILINYVF